MASASFRELVALGLLCPSPPTLAEVDALTRVGRTRLADAGNPALAPGSRFDLACNAANAFSLAALRWHGYRPNTRFYATDLTLGLDAAQCATLEPAWNHAHLANEGDLLAESDISLDQLIHVTQLIAERVAELGPPRADSTTQAPVP